MAIIAHKHLVISDTETGNAADDLNQNFRELANRTGQIVRVSGNTYTSYHPSADTDAARGTALESALTAATAGDSVLIGTGTYAVSAAMSAAADVSIIGMGRGTIIQRAGIVFDMTSLSGVTFQNLHIQGQCDFDACINVRFSGCTLDGNGQTNCVNAINTTGDTYDFSFYDCLIKDATSDNILLTKVDRVVIQGNRILSAGRDGINMEEGGASSSTQTVWNGPNITGNHFRENGRYGLRMNGVHDPVVCANQFEDSQTAGTFIRGPIQAVVVGNNYERNNISGTGNMSGILFDIVDASGFDSIGNEGIVTIEGNSFALEEIALRIIGSFSQHCLFKIGGNLFFNCPGINITGYDPLYHISMRSNIFDPGVGTPTTAISATGTSTTAADRVKIAENDIDGYSTGIELDGLTNVLVARNDILNTTTDQSLLNSATTRAS